MLNVSKHINLIILSHISYYFQLKLKEFAVDYGDYNYNTHSYC